ncbi:MAG: hypothetical protein ACRET2_06225 [Steroidobacteraceae bacterium]
MNRPEPTTFATARQHRRRCLRIALAAFSAALALAACGGSSKPSSTSPSASSKQSRNTGSPSSYAKSQLAAAACIRKHGVPNFPDPTFGAGGAQVNLTTPPGMLESPGFALAQKECAQHGLELAGYAPVSTATAAEMAQALAIARCMRAHGVPHWPDPIKTAPAQIPSGYGMQGAVPGPPGGPVFLIPKSIDPQAPAVKQAAVACHDG